MNPFNKDRLFNITSDREFEEIALEIYQYQIINNPIYFKYSQLILKGKKPKNIKEIPFLPINFFKTHKVLASQKKCDLIFQSSGTSGIRSKHYVIDKKLYYKSFVKNFTNTYGSIDKLCIIALLPSYIENGNSSLTYMVNELVKLTKNSESGFYDSNHKKISKILSERENNNKSTILIGVTYSLLDYAQKFGRPLKNTTIIETGGMKGKRQELMKEEVHKILKESFSMKYIHSEYGMTELLSQAYSLKDTIFETPKWMKILIRDINDPLTLLANNNTGGVNIIDLANIYSCSFIATQDLGMKINDDNFKITGRFSNSDVRGCNLLVE